MYKFLFGYGHIGLRTIFDRLDEFGPAKVAHHLLFEVLEHLQFLPAEDKLSIAQVLGEPPPVKHDEKVVAFHPNVLADLVVQLRYPPHRFGQLGIVEEDGLVNSSQVFENINR